MSIQITARLSNQTVDALDTAANQLRRSRADVIRLAVETYLEDYDDLALALERLRDPSDPVHDWDEVKSALFNSD